LMEFDRLAKADPVTRTKVAAERQA
jgi:hypothetical protein